MAPISARPTKPGLTRLTCLLLLLIAATRCQLDPKVALPLAALPAALRLTSAVAPGVDSTSCNGFWFKTGFVCDKEKTVEYANQDLARVNEEEIVSIDIIEKQLYIMKLAQPDFNKLNFRYSDLAKNWNYQSEKTKTQKEKAQAIQCWSLIKTLRTNSLCTTCSALNYRFYKNHLIGLPKSECTRFIDVCTVLFLSINGIGQQVGDLFSTLIRLHDPKNTVYSSKFASPHNNLRKLLEPTMKFMQQIAFKQNGHPGESEHIQAQICEQMLMIHKEPTLYRVTKHLKAAQELFLAEFGRLTGRKLELGIKRARSRGLVSETVLDNGQTIFAGPEVNVLNDVPYDIASDLITAATSPQLPMNCTLKLNP